MSSSKILQEQHPNETPQQIVAQNSIQKPNKKREVLLITALMFGYSLIYMDKNMISTAIIPIAEQFNLSTSQTGLIMSLFFLGYSLMQIPSGWLADKIGYKKVLILSLSLVAVFTFAFGFGGSLCNLYSNSLLRRSWSCGLSIKYVKKYRRELYER